MEDSDDQFCRSTIVKPKIEPIIKRRNEKLAVMPPNMGTQSYREKGTCQGMKNLKTFFGKPKSQAKIDADGLCAEYEAALEKNPLQKDLLMILGRLYHRKFQFKKAIEYKLKASNLSPEDPETKYSLGCSYSANGDYSEAIKCFFEALHFEPNYAEAYEALADQYYLLGKDGKADEYITRAQQIRS
jgi:tetratricopeptide (TPR) repeat protein